MYQSVTKKYLKIKKLYLVQSAVTRDIKSLSAAYSSGGMTVSIQQTDTDNYSFAAAGSELDTETVQVTLSFAF